MANHAPQSLVDCPYGTVQVPTLPTYPWNLRVAPAFDLHQSEVLLFFNENGVADVGEGHSDDEDGSAVVVREVDSFTGSSSAYANEYCPIFSLLFILFLIFFVFSLLIYHTLGDSIFISLIFEQRF